MIYKMPKEQAAATTERQSRYEVKTMEKKIAETMRLDKFLKVSRLLKRRTVANEACDAGKVDVNGRAAKPSCSVKVGDILSLTLGGVKQNFKILLLKPNTKKDDASSMYAVI